MAIVGITVDKEGAPIIRQAVTHKLVIGRGPGTKLNQTNYPKKLDHIAFMLKGPDGKWVDDDEITAHYRQLSEGKPPREVKIVVFDNDLEKVFPHQMAAWQASGCWCRGDGETAERRDLGKDGKGWGPFQPYKGPCANNGCPEPENKKCKATGTLYFSLMDFLKLGAVCKIQTTSKQSVAQIHGALMTLKRMTGGVLMGIPIKLFVQPDRTTFVEKGERKTGHKFVWGLEVSAPDVQELRRQLTSGPREFYEIRQLAQGTIIDADEEDEEDLAEEMEEFGFDKTSAGGSPGPSAECERADSEKTERRKAQAQCEPEQQSLDESALEEKAHELMTMMGMGNRAYRDAEIGKYRGRMQELVDALELKRKKSQKGGPTNDVQSPASGPGAAESGGGGSGAPPKAGGAKERVVARQKEKTEARQQKTEQQDLNDVPAKSASVAPGAQHQGGFDF